MRIITGRAGSGKTTLIFQELAQAANAQSGKQILIVPELFSHAYERRLAAATQGHGARTAEVLTFSRLTGRIFAEVGGLADTVLSPAGRLLTMQQAVRIASHNLRLYRSAVSKPETIRELLRVMDEMKGCDIPPEQLFSAQRELPPEDSALSDKLYDLAQIYTVYERLCAESLPDPRDTLTLLADRLPESHAFDGVSIYLDGFLGFTAQERNILAILLRKGLSMTACITCDFSQPDIFVSGCKTAQMLSRMAARQQIPVEHIALGASKMTRPHDLACLEQEGLLPARSPRPSDRSSLHLYAAASPYEECEYAAAYIRRTIRETGAHYRDFVVAAREIEPYAAVLQLVMERYEIPVFISTKSDLMQKPPLALVTGALHTVANGYRYEDLFGCLRTGLCALTMEEIDRLENYALTWRIQGNAWQRPFTEHPDGYGLEFDETAQQTLSQLNALRERMITPFAQLDAALQQSQTAKQFAQALYTFLEAVEAPVRLQERADMHENAGRLQLAAEYVQLWEIVVNALEQFAWVCGDAVMERTQFADLFTLVLSEYDVGTIPVSLDRVTCGDMQRVTSENVPHVILLGCNDGLLPKPPVSAGVFTDTDRLVLETVGMELSAAGAERMLMEMELLYRALACPRNSLLLCWHQADASGMESHPSYLIGSISAMLTDVPIENSASQRSTFRLQAPRPAIDLACSYLSGSEVPAAKTAYTAYQTAPEVQRASACTIARGPLHPHRTAHALYGKQLTLTASRMDVFYSCRFAFFMQYGLKAKTRKTAQFAAPQMGTFLHYVLENTLQELSESGENLAAVSTDTARRVMKKYIRQYINEQLGGLQGKSARFRYLFGRLVRSMQSILQDVLDELRNSAFRPIDYELNFAEDGDIAPIICEDTTVHAKLLGKVDRVDGYIQNGKLYIRVMDYKSGKKAFSLSDIWYGLNLQLILYLYALQDKGLDRYRKRLTQELNEIVPSGMLYIPAREELLDTDRTITEEELNKLRAKQLRRSGLVTDNIDILEAMEIGLSGDGRFLPVKLKAPKKEDTESPALSAASAVADLAKFGKLARYAQGKLLEMAHALEDGDIQANPYRNGQQEYCAWCEFRAACQFDEMAGDTIRTLRTIRDEEFWQAAGGTQNGDTMDRRTTNRD